MSHPTLPAGILFFVGLGSVFAQTQQVSTIGSSYPITLSPGSNNFYSVSISVQYPVGLTPGSYISGSQLNTDFQSFNTAYPNQQDPPEAIFSSVLTAILKKYSQMTGGSITATFGSTIAPGVTAPTGGTIYVVIGSFNGLTGLLSSASPASITKPSKAGPAQ